MKIKQAAELMRDNMIVKHYAGSISYGTSLPSSDTDFRGVFLADPINIRTPFYPIGEATDTTEEDTVLYELSKFMQLCTECNPNVIETLWVDRGHIVQQTPAYDLLRDAAPQLLSKKIAFTTSGYAISQLKRIKGHNKWLVNPQPEGRPQQKDFVSQVHHFGSERELKFDVRKYYRGHRLVPYGADIYGVYPAEGYRLYEIEAGSLNTEYEGDSHELGTPIFILKFNRQTYTDAMETWTNYWTWKKNRNLVRSELEAEHGYDTKHAMHLVRLLRMGAEALETGVVNVLRPDAEELLAIRGGKWTYDEVLAYATDMDDRVRNVLYKTSDLRKAPDIKFAAQLMMQIQDLMWSTK